MPTPGAMRVMKSVPFAVALAEGTWPADVADVDGDAVELALPGTPPEALSVKISSSSIRGWITKAGGTPSGTASGAAVCAAAARGRAAAAAIPAAAAAAAEPRVCRRWRRQRRRPRRTCNSAELSKIVSLRLRGGIVIRV